MAYGFQFIKTWPVTFYNSRKINLMNTAIRQTKNITRVVFIVTLFILYCSFFHCNNAKAADTENVLGWAWSENIGWISFNDLNCDVNGNGVYEGAAEGAPASCPIAGAVFPYGVNVNLNPGPTFEELSGYAWSENIGWISFDKAIAGNPPSAPFNGAETFMAKLDTGTNNFFGWARALNHSGGWDGWIKLRKDPADIGSAYGTSLNAPNFEGWAWGDVVVGWISFNSKNCDPDGDGSSNGVGNCPPAPTPMASYKVYLANNAPTVVPNSPALINYCVFDLPGGVTLSWTFDDTEDNANGIDQTAYEVEITRSDLAPPCLTGKQTTSDEFIMSTGIGGIDSSCPGFIDYGGFTYNWQVKVYDSDGADSGFVQELSSFPSDSFPSDGPTPTHRYPTANFSFLPPLPILQLQEITFDPLDPLNLSIAYGGASISSFEWDFGDGTLNPISSPLVNGGIVTHFYSEANLFTVDLKVTDDTLPIGYFCWASQQLNAENIPIGKNTPGWNETTP